MGLEVSREDLPLSVRIHNMTDALIKLDNPLRLDVLRELERVVDLAKLSSGTFYAEHFQEH